jgi:NADH-quinone oxidoreductase subunit E
MPWTAENRTTETVRSSDGPLLTDAMKQHLREKYLPRYPTKRAVLLPALHMVQHAYNWIPMQAVAELAEFLDIAPSEALDTATFYEEYYLKPKGKYLLQVCRSLPCEICRSGEVTDHLKQKLNLDPGQTTPDGRFTLVELECLGACGEAPVMLVNEQLLTNLTPESVDAALAALPDDPADYRDPSITWDEEHAPGAGH